MITFEPHSKLNSTSKFSMSVLLNVIFFSRLMNTSWTISDSDWGETHCIKVRRDKSNTNSSTYTAYMCDSAAPTHLVIDAHTHAHTCCMLSVLLMPQISMFMKCLGHNVCLIGYICFDTRVVCCKYVSLQGCFSGKDRFKLCKCLDLCTFLFV